VNSQVPKFMLHGIRSTETLVHLLSHPQDFVVNSSDERKIRFPSRGRPASMSV
jgi:hypothetical protein